MKFTEITQRYDGKYNLWHLTADPTCDTVILDEDNTPYIYKRWIIRGVYENEKEAQKAERDLHSVSNRKAVR